MNITSRIPLRYRRRFAPDTNQIRVLLIYEDLASGKRGMETYHYLVALLGDEYEFSCNLWNFHLLQVADLCGRAAVEAAESDIIIVSINHEQNLPDALKEWTNLWLELDRKPSQALVAVAAPEHKDSEESTVKTAFLRDVASRGGLGFFSPRFVPSLKPSSRYSETLGRIVDQAAPYTHWGINE